MENLMRCYEKAIEMGTNGEECKVKVKILGERSEFGEWWNSHEFHGFVGDRELCAVNHGVEWCRSLWLDNFILYNTWEVLTSFVGFL